MIWHDIWDEFKKHQNNLSSLEFNLTRKHIKIIYIYIQKIIDIFCDITIFYMYIFMLILEAACRDLSGYGIPSYLLMVKIYWSCIQNIGNWCALHLIFQTHIVSLFSWLGRCQSNLMRLGLSALNSQRYMYNMVLSPSCERCGAFNESHTIYICVSSLCCPSSIIDSRPKYFLLRYYKKKLK